MTPSRTGPVSRRLADLSSRSGSGSISESQSIATTSVASEVSGMSKARPELTLSREVAERKYR